MPPVGFELTIPASKRPQTYALDRADTGTGSLKADLHIACRAHAVPLPCPTAKGL